MGKSTTKSKTTFGNIHTTYEKVDHLTIEKQFRRRCKQFGVHYTKRLLIGYILSHHQPASISQLKELTGLKRSYISNYLRLFIKVNAIQIAEKRRCEKSGRLVNFYTEAPLKNYND